ncbi:hypothetical protein ACFL3H_03940 [Gemmatimonadota bacterium]
MKNAFLYLVSCLILFTACSTNRLAHYELRDANIAAQTFMPPRANVFTDMDVYIDPDHLLRSAIRIGTSVVREVEAEKARARLDSAMAMVDVPAIIEEEVLFQAADMLNFQPINQTRSADFVFNIDIKRYGIDARSWDDGTYFIIDAHIELVDNMEHRRIWKSHVDERESLSPRIFGLDSPIENVLDALTLSALSVEEMATGLAYMADFSAGLIVEKLYRDFVRSRRK